MIPAIPLTGTAKIIATMFLRGTYNY